MGRAFHYAAFFVLFAMNAVPAAAELENRSMISPGPGWQTYADGNGTVLDYPANIFSVPDGSPPIGSGRNFRSRDGRAQLSVYTLRNSENDTPRSYLAHHLRPDHANLDYHRVTDRFFAISGIKDGATLYARCNFASGPRRAMHCLSLRYPAIETHAWDALVTRMSLSLRASR
jgi:hypothetical protein